MSTQVALLQQNPVVGDVVANTKQLIETLKEARRLGADIAISSELISCGYPPRDLLDRPSFVRLVDAATAQVVANTGDCALVFGTIGRNGNQLTNDAVVARGGQEIARASKQLLPTYDVFDESRYFAAGTELCISQVAGLRCAVSICEDAWAGAPEVAHRYRGDPLAAVGPENTDLLINLSASPYTRGKLNGRNRLFSELAARHQVPVAITNQVGANDELIFDGRSAMFSKTGELLAQAKMFEEDLLLSPLGGAGRRTPPPDCDEQAAYAALVCGVQDYARKCGFSRTVLGLSGGIDSALVATIAADALGPENVTGIAMPTRYSSKGSVDDAAQLGKNLGLNYRLVDIDPIFASYISTLEQPLDEAAPAGDADVTWENVQARIRGATVMAVSNRTGALALTTGNKSEIAVGYCTLYGDMVGGLSVISDVPKTLVYRLARHVNKRAERIPWRSIEKPPSAELRPNQVDADSLPPYDILDPLLEAYVEEHRSVAELLAQGYAPNLVHRIVKLVTRAEYKRRQAAPGLIISPKAFGVGRRMPIAHRFNEFDDAIGVALTPLKFS